MFNLIPYSRRNSGISRKDDWFGIDRFFDDFQGSIFCESLFIDYSIRADVRETEKEYVVEAELPGVNKEDIVIDLHDDVLTLGVDIKQEKMKKTTATFTGSVREVLTDAVSMYTILIMKKLKPPTKMVS